MTKRLLIMFLLMTACAANAQASLVYTATLSGLAESPPNGSLGGGSALVEYDAVAHTLLMANVEFWNLTGVTSVAHIHCCVLSPGNAGVAVFDTGIPIGVQAGTYSNTIDLTLSSSFGASFLSANGGTTGGAEAALATGLANGQAYFNIHTNVYPVGEIRGFLQPVPLPPAAWLFGSGLLGLIGVARRKKA